MPSKGLGIHTYRLVEVGQNNEGHNYWKQVKLDYMNADLFPVALMSGDI
jgi:hypothetical protein